MVAGTLTVFHDASLCRQPGKLSAGSDLGSATDRKEDYSSPRFGRFSCGFQRSAETSCVRRAVAVFCDAISKITAKTVQGKFLTNVVQSEGLTRHAAGWFVAGTRTGDKSKKRRPLSEHRRQTGFWQTNGRFSARLPCSTATRPRPGGCLPWAFMWKQVSHRSIDPSN